MTQAEGQGVRSTGGTRVHAHGSVCKETWFCTCVTCKRQRESQKVAVSLSEHASVFGWYKDGEREKLVNDKLGPASQSHFLNGLYPKSYKSNTPFRPYWSHFCTQSHLFPQGFELNCVLAFFPPLPLIFTL